MIKIESFHANPQQQVSQQYIFLDKTSLTFYPRNTYFTKQLVAWSHVFAPLLGLAWSSVSWLPQLQPPVWLITFQVFVDQIFRIFDKDGDGSIDFRVRNLEFIIFLLSLDNFCLWFTWRKTAYIPHWPMAVSRCIMECLLFYAFSLILYSQGLIVWSLENVW